MTKFEISAQDGKLNASGETESKERLTAQQKTSIVLAVICSVTVLGLVHMGGFFALIVCAVIGLIAAMMKMC